MDLLCPTTKSTGLKETLQHSSLIEPGWRTLGEVSCSTDLECRLNRIYKYLEVSGVVLGLQPRNQTRVKSGRCWLPGLRKDAS